MAAAFADRYGIGKGDRVAILGANSPEWIVAFWATISLGAVAIAMNGWWAGDEIRYALADSDPKLLVADEKRLARIDGDAGDVPVVEMESGFAELWEYDPARRAADRPHRGGRSRADPLHERHDRPSEGRDQQPPQRERPRRRLLLQPLAPARSPRRRPRSPRCS